MGNDTIKSISKLILEKMNLENKIQELTKSLNFNDMSFEELSSSYKILHSNLSGIAWTAPYVIEEVLSCCNFTWHDTFYLERYQTQYYCDLIDLIKDWNEDYAPTKNKCTALKNWAKTSDLTEAKNKFIRIIIRESLTHQQEGFEYDW